MRKTLAICAMLFCISGFSQTDSTSKHIDPKTKEQAKKKIESIRQDILAGKIDFAAAAKMYSMDTGSAANGGLLGSVRPGDMVPQFEAVSFKVKVKELSEVFETEFGYHILIVDAKRGTGIDVRHILIAPK